MIFPKRPQLPLVFIIFLITSHHEVVGQISVIRLISILASPFYQNPPAQSTMSTPQMIRFNNYPLEEHNVQTPDGYILTLFRIPRGKNVNPGQDKKTGTSGGGRPVLLMHGDFSSCNDWLLLPSDVALPYILAESGHDVWLGNARGNNYSMRHVSMSPNDPKFWDFSYDELGIYDIPAVINYILDLTKYDRLNWVGHSAGTSTFFIAMDQQPELNLKVDKMVALAPSFYIANSRFRFETLVPPQILQPFFSIVTGGRLIPSRILDAFQRLAPPICSGRVTQGFCKNVIFLIGGNNPEQVTPETASLITGHTPSHTSGKLVIQMGQTVRAGRLRRFDYGPKVNMEKYGSSNPPDFNLSRVTVPVLAFYGLNDVRNHPLDAKRTIQELGNVAESVEVEDPKWTHLDFMYGKDAKRFVYNKILSFLKEDNKFS